MGSIGTAVIRNSESTATSTKFFNKFEEVFREARDGWTFGKTSAEEIWVGTKEEIMESAKDTPENRKRLNSLWETNNFSKEVKRRK